MTFFNIANLTFIHHFMQMMGLSGDWLVHLDLTDALTQIQSALDTVLIWKLVT